MKIVQVMPVVYGKPTLKTILKKTEREIRWKGTTFIRQKEGRWVHIRYPGWINWQEVNGAMLVAEVRSRKPKEEWQLLQSFVGYLDRHMGKYIRQIGITYCGDEVGVPKKAKPRRRNRRKQLSRIAIRGRVHASSSRKLAATLGKHNIATNRPARLPFKGECYTFTGKFDYGYQRECEKATKARGAKILQDVTRETTVLVVGAKGSPFYFWKKYGIKIAKAGKWRSESENRRPLIVTEYTWASKL